jgi:hypothetical protein
MAAVVWITNAGSLGNIPESIYYEVQLDAYTSIGGVLAFKIIAGSIPSGLTLTSTGLLSGIPNAVTEITTKTFTVRATNSQGKISDRTFSVTIGGLVSPIINQGSGSLGAYIDGQLIDIQLTVTEPPGNLSSTFSLFSGQLPQGVTLSSSGRLYGYISPASGLGAGSPGFDLTGFDTYSFDYPGVNVSKNYQFQIKADDTVKTDINTYTLYVYSRTSLTADNYIAANDPARAPNSNIVSADSDLITVDTVTVYSPILLTSAGRVGTIRQNTLFQYQFNAIDFNDDTLTYHIVSGSLPTGLSLTSSTGWITGIVPFGPLGSVTYSFTMNVSKVSGATTYTSETKTFNIKIQGQVSDTVNWITPSSIGSLYNGAISEFFISATTPSGKLLQYSLIGSSIGSLPAGLELLNNGLISGRCSFQASGTYSFTVAAFDSDNFVYDEKTFTIIIVTRDQKPYENLYIQALPNRSQRRYYDNIINNTDIFPSDVIYRSNDPWFGKNSLIRSLFLTGLNPLDSASYASAMALNHYWKTLTFGNVKTAQALDENFNVKYEVVYVELLDPELNDHGLGPNIAVSLPTNSSNVSTIYPNNFPNMVKRLADGVGYENRSILPDWMTSRQTNGAVLGFTRALVLCYVQPGRSAEVAYRVKKVEDNFKLIDFTIDRYEWDSILSNSWIKGSVTGTGNIVANTQSATITGIGTDFTSELDANSKIYSSNVFIGTVSSVTSSTIVTLTANATANVTSHTFAYGNEFMVNNYTTGSGTITANIRSNVVLGSNVTTAGAGRISGVSGSATITGNSATAFNSTIAIGKTLYVANTRIGTVATISNAHVLTLADPLNSTISNVSYSFTGNITSFTNDILLGDNIVSNGIVLGNVATIVDDFTLVLSANSAANVTSNTYSYTNKDPYTVPGQGDKYLKFPNIRVITSAFTTPEY